MDINIEYLEGLETQEIVEQLEKLSSPQIIMWYIGIYGLKKQSVDFYREELIYPIFSKNPTAFFWLVDLTAWGAFKNSKVPISRFSCHATKLNERIDKRIKCIKSSDIFNKMQSIDDSILIQYFKKALLRKFVWAVSNNAKDSQLTIRDIFNNYCPLLSDFFDCNLGKSYSMLQYLEGCLLIDEIIHFLCKNKFNDEVEISFVIPNDEIKYYQGQINYFQMDVNYLINFYKLNISFLRKVNIKFLAFNYGNSIENRPYNAPGKVLKENQLTPKLVKGRNTKYKAKEYVTQTIAL